MVRKSKLIFDWGQRRERDMTGRRPRKFWSGGGSGNVPYLDCGGVPWKCIFG